MGNRWMILTVLFFARTAMGFQFQSVASLSSLLIQDLNMDYTMFGLLIGIYSLPGIALAIPGGLVGDRFGDKRVTLLGLALMAAGGFVTGISHLYAVALAGRLMSGVGAVLLNVLTSKMIADWFAGREIVTAMGILVSSWPLGISLGLLSQGSLAIVSSWMFVMHVTAGVCLVSFLLVLALYRSPAGSTRTIAAGSEAGKLSPREIGLVILAGLIWTLYNAGFIVLPSFAPAYLISTGFSLEDAGSLISVACWICIGSVQLGGYLAELIKRPNLVMVVCFLGFGLGICVFPFVSNPLWSLIFLGLIGGPAAGVIMALAVEVLRLENRAAGMGVYWTISYAGSASLTTLAGYSRDLTESAAAPMWFGGLMMFAAIVTLGLFRSLQKRAVRVPSG